MLAAVSASGVAVFLSLVAGVAGGVLAAESIRSMLGGSQAKAGESGGKENLADASSADRQREQDLQQDLEQDRELEHDQTLDDGFDGDGDFGDDSLDI